MTLSYDLAYQEIILVHPTRRQIFAGRPYSTFWNVWEGVILQPTNYVIISWLHKNVIVMMSIMKMRGPVYVLFAFQIFSLLVPLPKLFGKYQTRPEVKNPYPLDPACMKRRLRISVICLGWAWNIQKVSLLCSDIKLKQTRLEEARRPKLQLRELFKST